MTQQLTRKTIILNSITVSPRQMIFRHPVIFYSAINKHISDLSLNIASDPFFEQVAH